MRHIGITAIVMLALGASPGFADNKISPDGLKASANSVTVGSMTADKAGYVIVHETDANGAPGNILGEAEVKQGENLRISIPLGKKVKSGTKLIVMLHEETDGDTKFGPEDRPVMTNGGPVQQTVTVQ